VRGQGHGLRLAGVAKSYGSVTALRQTDLTVEPGEFLTLLGPSGSGKTTLLNLVAGYVSPNEGRIFVGDRDLTTVPARRRNIGMVFQNYALFPHLDVAGNIAYGLKVRGVGKAEIAERVSAVLALVQLDGYGGRAIQQLSGGQQQRVALARALVIEPDILLMDEPLGALDRQLRKIVQLELRRLHETHRRTTIYVTHDQEEALILSDRVAVMHDSRIIQIGTAAELYTEPVDAFVAGFIGESNLLPARVIALSGGIAAVEVPELRRELCVRAAPGVAVGRSARLLIRPEHLQTDATQGITGVVDQVVYLGELVAARVTLETGGALWIRRVDDKALAHGAKIEVGWAVEHLRVVAESSGGG
jgi:putative spermidine/putrescine transport system ATP-binding protein